MFFNKQRFTRYLEEKEELTLLGDRDETNKILPFQRKLRDEEIKETLRAKGIFHATELELTAFLAIDNDDLAQLAVELKSFIKESKKFLYQLTTEALADDQDTKSLALKTLQQRNNAGDLHAAYNLIVIKYQLEQITALEAKQELQVLENKFRNIIASNSETQKIKYGKEFARFMAMLQKGHAYITNHTKNVKTLPLFETSKGEKRRSKLALTTFTVLATLSLAATMAAGLVFGGYIVVLPTFLAWAAPIALSLLIGLSVATSISVSAILAEAFKPKAIKYFFQGLGRTLKSIALGLKFYLKELCNRGTIFLHVNPFYELDNNDRLKRIGIDDYKESLKEHRIKTILQSLLYPFACLLGAVISLIASPFITAIAAYEFVDEADEPEFITEHRNLAKAIAVIGSLLTWPLSYIALLCIGGEAIDKSRDENRKRLFEEAKKENLSSPTAADNYEHVQRLFDTQLATRLAVKGKESFKLNSRLASLENNLKIDISRLPADQQDEFAQQQIDALQVIINEKEPHIKRGNILQNTGFIRLAYSAFGKGIFQKPAKWPATIEELKGQPYTPSPLS